MKLPSFKRIRRQDYKPEFGDLINTLSGTLNNAVELIYDVLNKKVSLKDNILCSVKDVELKVDADGDVTEGGTFTLDYSGATLGLHVIKADNLTNSTIYPTSAPFITWEVVSNGIKIINVSGLPEENLFRLRVLAWGA
jgi:hypothetical protein